MRPLYEQLAETLKRQIDAGEYGPGDWLPSEREISEQHSVSRNTVRLALQALVSEGAIEAKPSRGYVVPAPGAAGGESELDRIKAAISRIEQRLDRLEGDQPERR